MSPVPAKANARPMYLSSISMIGGWLMSMLMPILMLICYVYEEWMDDIQASV